jgi:DNA topoisomerase-1
MASDAPEGLSIHPQVSAAAAGLQYVDGSGPCIRRIRCGKGFRYVDERGQTIKDKRTLERIESLVIPPAWENVWICPAANGHIQAIGWDARGRKQYRYHALYRQVRDEAKFGRMIAFGAALAVIRKRVEEDLAQRGLPRSKVLATVVKLLEATSIRVGNEAYARDNDSFGLTTLRDDHVEVTGRSVKFSFKGKSGKSHEVEMNDLRLARIIKQCQDLPGQELFQYVDTEGETCTITSSDVNAYLRDITGQDFTAKDFRTWSGTVLAAQELDEAGPCTSDSDGKKKIVAAVKRVAGRLGNRPATCRKYYIHPAVFESYADGSLFPIMRAGEDQERAYAELGGLRREEYCAIAAITQYSEKQAKEVRRARRAA